MARLRFAGVAALALALALSPAHAKKPGAYSGSAGYAGGTYSRASAAAPTATPAYVIYSLADMGGDPDLGSWVASTIPEVIDPVTWKGAASLRYYPPKNILVVYHTPAVQAKVAGFLKDLKKSMPRGKTAPRTAGRVAAQGVVPAGYMTPALLRTSGPAPESNPSYLVPAPVRPPKHLFHFIIRYEGEGIIDENVVKLWRIQCAQDKKVLTGTIKDGLGDPTHSTEKVDAPDADKKPKKDAESGPPTVLPPPPTTDKKDKKEDKKDKEDEKDKEK